MNAFFIIPLFVSKNNSGNVISIVSKCIETVNISAYSGIFQGASMKFVDEYNKNKLQKEEIREATVFNETINNLLSLNTKAELLSEYEDRYEDRKDKEVISFNPTVLKVKVATGKRSEERNEFTFGIKCVPFYVDDIKEVVNFINEMVNYNKYGRLFALINYLMKYSRVGNNKFKDIYKYVDKAYSFRGKLNSDIVYGMMKKNMYYSKNISKSPKVLTFAISVLNHEFSEDPADISKFVFKYSSLSKKGLGDFVILDDVKESMIYCNHKMKVCDIKSFSDILPLFGKEELSISTSGSGINFSPF